MELSSAVAVSCSHRRGTSASKLGLLVSDAILLSACYILAAFLTLGVDPLVFLQSDNEWLPIALGVALILTGFYFLGLYRTICVSSGAALLRQVGFSVGFAVVVQAMLAYLDLRDLIVPPNTMLAGSVLACVAIPLWRISYGTIVLRALASERVLFVGASDLVREVSAYWNQHPESGRTPIGFLEEGASPGTVEGAGRLGTTGDLASVAERFHPDRIVVGLQERRNRLPVSELLELRLSGIQVTDVADAYEAAFGRISTRELRPAQLIFATGLDPSPRRVWLQSLYGIAIAALAAALAAPFMGLIAIGVKMGSRGPILFRQQRAGLHGRTFTLYKFRSMAVDAGSAGAHASAGKDDPRITKFGSWLRKRRLDNLPQLFNVLKGDMSIVGPQPERPEFVRELDKRVPYYRQRHCVKPGITGWAQIHRHGDSMEDALRKLEYDLYYIKNLGPALDTVILFRTARMMLSGRRQ
ncbi:MAG TPA: sugar transferase [Bryobacteraceae bacterium]